MSVKVDMHEIHGLEMSIQEFRRTYFRAIRGGVKDAAETHIVPRIRAHAAPTALRGLVRVSTTSRGGDFWMKFTNVGGRKGRILGLQNFGGNLTRPVMPRKKKALRTPFGPKAVVRGKAHVTGKHFYERGIDAGLPSYNRDLGRMIADRLDAALHK